MIWKLINILIGSCYYVIILISLYILFLFCLTKRSNRKCRYAIFHPYCSAGGGGERVLWMFVRYLCDNYRRKGNDDKIIIFTGDVDVSPEEIIRKVRDTFRMEISLDDVDFIYLRSRFAVEAKWYPFFTLLFQSLGSIIVGMEALMKKVPDVYIDTMGYSFTYPLFKFIGRSRVISYTHYPTISCDMLSLVTSRESSFNNRRFISNSQTLTNLKYHYYQLFSKLYGFTGRQSDLIMVNSSWTKGHIEHIWRHPNLELLYAPCDFPAFKTLPLSGRKLCHVVSIAQFRPEKNHLLQAHVYASFLQRLRPELRHESRMYFVGSCRDSEDEKRVDELKNACELMNISDKVKFKVNVSFNELLQIVSECNIGLHTMKNEHFGISVVEMIAGGLIVIAHDSGGPKLDIIKNENGFLASSDEEYVESMMRIVSKSEKELDQMRASNREAMNRFGDEIFLRRLSEIFPVTD